MVNWVGKALTRISATGLWIKPAHCQAMRQHRGFTLIELLVVVAIIGIIITMVVLAIGQPGDEKLQQETRRFSALFQLAREEAMLQSQEYAVGFWENGYAFYQLAALGPEARWQALTKDNVLRARELSDDIELQLTLEGREVIMSPNNLEEPQVFLLSSGEVSPFELEWTLNSEFTTTLAVDPLGVMEWLADDDFAL